LREINVKRKLLPNRRGVSTVMIASMFLIILTFSVLALLLSGYFGYNLAINEQMKIEQERAQEKIILSQLGLDVNATVINYVRVNNTGTITVKIRAIYETNRTMTGVFLGDPSTWMDTYIEPNEDLVIWGQNYTALTRFRPSAKLTLVTERGTKTTDFEGLVVYGRPKPPNPYEPSKYYIGPFELWFTAFYYRRIDQFTGALGGTPYDPVWHDGWNITRNYGYIAWNITVRNIDNRAITINKFSSFTVVPNESPPSNDQTWYLEPKNQTTNTQTLVTGQLDHIVYKWDKPKWEGGFKAQQIYAVPTRCLVFLTFYGVFHEHDGTTTVYAQTIPFEAAITVI